MSGGLNFNDLFAKAEYVDEHDAEGAESAVPVNADRERAEQALKPVDLDGQWEVRLVPLPPNLPADQRCTWCPENERATAAGLASGSGAPVCESCAAASLGGRVSEGGRVVGVTVEEPVRVGPSAEQRQAEVDAYWLAQKRGQANADEALLAERNPLPGALSFMTGSQLRARPIPPFLIDGVMPAVGIGFNYAEEASFKTFVDVIHPALCVANGSDYFGHKVNLPGLAFIFLGEGGVSFGQRLNAALLHHRQQGWTDENVLVIDADNLDFRVDLMDKRCVDLVIESINQVSEALGVPARWVCFDTVGDFMEGEIEKPQDAKVLVESLKRIATRCRVFAKYQHHTGWDTTRETGARKQRRSADLVTRMERDDKDNMTVRVICSKAKHDEPFETIHAKLVTVPLPDGRTSLAVEEYTVMERGAAELTKDEQFANAAREIAAHLDGVTNKATFARKLKPEYLRVYGKPSVSEKTLLRRVDELMAQGVITPVERAEQTFVGPGQAPAA
ncbi:AAA family ATPase [Streptomyces sp. NPDC003710]